VTKLLIDPFAMRLNRISQLGAGLLSEPNS